MDTPQQKSLRSHTNSLVTDLSSDCEYTEDNFNDDSGVMSEETCIW